MTKVPRGSFWRLLLFSKNIVVNIFGKIWIFLTEIAFLNVDNFNVRVKKTFLFCENPISMMLSKRPEM